TIARLTKARSRERIKQEVSSVAADAGGEKMIDHATLAELESFSCDSGFVPELVQSFVMDNDALLQQMRSRLNPFQIQAFKDLAHGMKGNAVSVGAYRLAELCSEMICAEEKALYAESDKT